MHEFSVGDIVEYSGGKTDLEGELGLIITVEPDFQLFSVLFEKHGMRYAVHKEKLTFVKKFKWPSKADLKKENKESYVSW